MQITDLNLSYHSKGGNDAQFMASDFDEVASTKYYGFITSDGRWMIMEKTATTLRYRFGQDNYKTATTGAWAVRASGSYNYFNEARPNG
jgi:hypothetical protein